MSYESVRESALSGLNLYGNRNIAMTAYDAGFRRAVLDDLARQNAAWAEVDQLKAANTVLSAEIVRLIRAGKASETTVTGNPPTPTKAKR